MWQAACGRPRGQPPCISEGCSATVVERADGRGRSLPPGSTKSVVETGRLAQPAAEPEQLPELPSRKLESARTGRARHATRVEQHMTEQSHNRVLAIGIDVSQATLDVAMHPSGEYWQVRNDPAGIAHLVERLQP